MALPDSLKYVNGTQIVLADTTDYSSSFGLPARTDQIDLTSLAATPAYRESAKFSLGTNRAPLYHVSAAIEWGSAPTAGQTVDFYIGFSNSATAGNDNPGNLAGSDQAYVGYGAATTDAGEAVKQLTYIGSLVATADADTQIAEVGYFIPRGTHAMIVAANNSGAALQSDAVEHAIIITPVEEQVQD